MFSNLVKNSSMGALGSQRCWRWSWKIYERLLGWETVLPFVKNDIVDYVVVVAIFFILVIYNHI